MFKIKGSIWFAILLIFILVTCSMWLGYRLGNRNSLVSSIPVIINDQECKSKVVWSQGDFKDTETQMEYVDPDIETITKESEDILFQFTTTGEFSKYFEPIYFLKVEGTDLSKCLINDRLRINLDGKIYWIRLEED